MLHVNGAALNCISSCAGSAGCRKTLHRCELRCTGLFSLTLAALALATLATSSLMTAFIASNLASGLLQQWTLRQNGHSLMNREVSTAHLCELSRTTQSWQRTCVSLSLSRYFTTADNSAFTCFLSLVDSPTDHFNLELHCSCSLCQRSPSCTVSCFRTVSATLNTVFFSAHSQCVIIQMNARWCHLMSTDDA